MSNSLGQMPIYIHKVRDKADIPKAVRIGFDSLGDLALGPNSAVAIKPNLCAIRTPETGATTDVRVVEAIIHHLKDEFGISDISVVESDGTQVLADMAFKLLGYERMAQRLKVKLANLSKAAFTEREFSNNVFIKKLKIPRIIENADFFISVPKIKTHSNCRFSGVLKNQYGCNPFPRKRIYHQNFGKRFADAIVDFNLIFKPNMIVVDGIVAMEGHQGPTEGPPIKLNVLIFGLDSVAVDHLICRLMGIDPNRVKYLVEARKRGIGEFNYNTIGASLSEVKVKFRSTPPRWHNLFGLLH